MKIETVRMLRGELMNYSVPYMVSFFGFDTSKISDLISLGIFLMLVFLMQAKEKVILLNPIAALMNYSLFECKNANNEEIVILSKAIPRLDSELKLKEISKGIYLQNIGN